MSEDSPRRGTQVRHPDGTHEVVFHVEGERVLTVREYPTTERYLVAVERAEPDGIHEGVVDLPGPEAFRSEPE